jgi:hypothetical protein
VPLFRPTRRGISNGNFEEGGVSGRERPPRSENTEKRPGSNRVRPHKRKARGWQSSRWLPPSANQRLRVDIDRTAPLQSFACLPRGSTPRKVARKSAHRQRSILTQSAAIVVARCCSSLPSRHRTGLGIPVMPQSSVNAEPSIRNRLTQERHGRFASDSVAIPSSAAAGVMT